MAVLCEAISVVVATSILDARYPGGADGYALAAPNATVCTDGVLTRVGFMNPRDVQIFCEALANEAGLVLAGPTGFVDFAVVDELAGPTMPCAWLHFARDDGVSRVWHAESQGESDLAVPIGWTPGHVAFYSDADLPGMPVGRTTEDTTSMLDPTTGEVRFSTSTFPESVAELHAALERFVMAQDQVYADVLRELRTGRKSGHWMWFTFPQIQGLGQSSTSRRYAITSRDEARVYLAHPVLGPRLLECARLVMQAPAGSIDDVLGPLDALKLRSSMTLFGTVTNEEEIFTDILRRHFNGEVDERTLELLEEMEPDDPPDAGPVDDSVLENFDLSPYELPQTHAQRIQRRHLAVTPIEGESREDFAERVAKHIREHFGRQD